MARVLKREAAKRDLLAQWVWYAENADIEVADRFLRAAEMTLALLARHPMSGTPTVFATAELSALRRFPIGDGFGKILAFYIPHEDGIDLVRVVHGSRDLPSLFEDN